MKSNLAYIVRQPKVASKKPPLLVLLHGYGSNEEDLFSFASELPDELLIISVRAPHEMSHGGYAWYAINLDAGSTKHSDLKQARTSLAQIASFIEEIKVKFNTNPNKTFLLGFSQGAILSYAFSFNYPNKVNYIIALSGYINTDLLPEKMPFIETEYYISHGTADQVLSVEEAKKAPKFLDHYKLPNVYSEYPVGHGVAPQNFYSFKTWIEERL